MSGVVFEDIFHVKNVDPDGKKFDRVSRLFCDSETFEFVFLFSSLIPLQHELDRRREHAALPDEGRQQVSSDARDDAAQRRRPRRERVRAECESFSS